MLNREFDRPIFIIGAARSGTTILGQILSTHPKVAYWLEPKYIWRYGNANASSDIRIAGEAEKEIKGYIRKRFDRYLKNNGKTRLVEKTPSNAFRIPFIYKVFPEARFIHIVRDGREVCLSAEKKWTSPPDSTAIVRRLRSFEIPLADLHHYILDAVRDVPGRLLFPKKGFIWGPRFDGIQSYRKNHTVLETCAIQWVKSMEAIEAGFEELPPERIFSIRYEELLSDPERHLEELCNFADLAFQNYRIPAVLLKKKKIKENIVEDTDKIKSILPIINKTLSRWDYVK